MKKEFEINSMHRFLFNNLISILVILIWFYPTSAFSGTTKLSTPDKTIGLFVKAFQDGDDDLLNEVLSSNASIPEFNPIQKIECASPEIIGFDILKLRVVLTKDQYAAGSIPGDIEVHVILNIDEKKVKKNSKCILSLWSKGVYLLRKIDNDWKIISAIPFWPEKIEKMME